MIVDQALQQLIERTVPPRTFEPFAVAIDVPKSHSGLPRLVEAATRLPIVTMVQSSGVSYTKRGLLRPDAFGEFFAALRGVVGNDFVDEVEERLGFTQEIEPASEEQILDLLAGLHQMLPIGKIQQML